ncbi:MAG: UDP-N-acetylglucosamine 2-epimerase (non-hydrolyzing) [Nitrospirae bacterium]|nr:MAG: UDP-N-acetylglucosamine 2-epimerase (non-hydrolyzing) [Nitrospirota bacterium]
MKLVTVVGARPQFIKAAPVSRAIRAREHHARNNLTRITEVLLHTGQHYDDNMSEVFFRQLDIPKPDYHLGVGSGPHGAQTGEMLSKIEEVLVKERPDLVLVYGDTNSTLAAALAAAKLNIPVGHVEAGLRGTKQRIPQRWIPEEINRAVTDHVSSLLFCPTETAVKNLVQEGIVKGVHLVGDVMYDALLYNVKVANTTSKILVRLNLASQEYYLATVHRAENTDDLDRLSSILEGFRKISEAYPVIWPVHPRTRKVLESSPSTFLRSPLSSGKDARLQLIEPVPYLDMLALESHARCILTDSGGVQKEAYWLRVPCVTLREETEWVETLELGWNKLVGTNPQAMCEAAHRPVPPEPSVEPFGNGRTAESVVAVITCASMSL